jgi:hypothetical protein
MLFESWQTQRKTKRMFILAGTCLFLGIVLGIMGLMAWGAMTTQPPTDEEHAAENTNEEPRD